jgi:hypothetical protein
MSVISLADINHAILYGSFTNEQLNSIGDAIKFARGQIATRNKYTMRAGAQVKFKHTGTGQTILATVEKVNRKFILVRENGKAHGVWRVPANMLETV